MDALDQALHVLNFIAPAWALAVGLVLVTQATRRWWALASAWRWRTQIALQGVLGSAVLLGGLAWFGADGKMATYGTLVVLAGSVQWLMARGWR